MFRIVFPRFFRKIPIFKEIFINFDRFHIWFFEQHDADFRGNKLPSRYTKLKTYFFNIFIGEGLIVGALLYLPLILLFNFPISIPYALGLGLLRLSLMDIYNSTVIAAIKEFKKRDKS